MENSPPGIQAIASGAGLGADVLFSIVGRKADELGEVPLFGSRDSEAPKLEFIAAVSERRANPDRVRHLRFRREAPMKHFGLV